MEGRWNDVKTNPKLGHVGDDALHNLLLRCSHHIPSWVLIHFQFSELLNAPSCLQAPTHAVPFSSNTSYSPQFPERGDSSSAYNW